MNGRIEITLGGKLRQLRFNNYAKEELGNFLSKDPVEGTKELIELLQSNPLKAIKNLTYCGLVGHYEAREMERDFTKQDVAEWVGDADDKDLSDVFNCWLNTTQWRSIIPEQKATEEVNVHSEDVEKAKKKAGRKSRISQ
ncbi:hypothetical protein [Chitinophaga pinensis]|uniref:Uncharacterized protein n=1 Tax=Chitinophaga pinensis (strain ATCC 43595 / DSM 2588 / LMG 13176 / NBRC 15968 / NCIMB 11800 / UQM 2034) TaxID=485918 RepID=A0A979G601_CHIPD|nr:hypothetical protein [Chitinophaga pinensis]ACU61361.1 hypothetical protein Cpin_3899 [Chitinophaga pinensis DSM 2588]